jgi:hypothetical protein
MLYETVKMFEYGISRMTCHSGQRPGVVKARGEFPGGPACRQAGVFDETGETVAIATILTMVKKLDKA